jgi:hypothetical protein
VKAINFLAAIALKQSQASTKYAKCKAQSKQPQHAIFALKTKARNFRLMPGHNHVSG